MHAGLLRERVTIQVATWSKGAAGGRVASWGEVKTVWARIEQSGGKDQEDQGQQREAKAMKVTVRKRFALSATDHRLIWKSRVLNILSVADDEIGDKTVMSCEEGRGGGG